MSESYSFNDDDPTTPTPSGGLPVSTGANKVLFDDGETQGWSDAPVLSSLTTEWLDEGDDFPHGIRLVVSGDGSGIEWRNWQSGVFNRVIRFQEPGGRVVIGPDAGNGVYLQGYGDTEVGLDCNLDAENPCFFAGVGNSGSFDWTHEGALLFGRLLNATDDDQTWFGDTVNPVFLVGTPAIHLLSPLVADLDFVVTILDNAAGTGDPGGVQIWAGAGDNVGGDLDLRAGNGLAGDANGGDVRLNAGEPFGAGLLGRLTFYGRAIRLNSDYLNFGTEADGEEGFGLRNNSGTIEAKNVDGEWAPLPVTPGDDTQVLFNDGGAIGASERLHYNKVNCLFQVDARDDFSPDVVSTPGGDSTTWNYAVVATFPGGATTAYVESQTVDGAATLDETHYNTLTWAAVPGASLYTVYRAAAAEGATPTSIGVIGTTTDTTFVDNGVAGDDSTERPENTTGNSRFVRLHVDGKAFLHGPLVSDSDTLTLGLPGAPTAGQTITPAASTPDGDGNYGGTYINLGATHGKGIGNAAGAFAMSGGNWLSTDEVTFTNGASFGTNPANELAGGSLALYSGAHSAGPVGASIVLEGATATDNGTINLSGATIADAAITAPDFIVSGSRFKTDTVDGHAASLSAYDVDGAAYVDFITVTNGMTPVCQIAPPSGAKLAIVLPTSDPGVAGALWNNSGAFAISMG